MKILVHRLRARATRRFQQKGSALLVSLMVMVGLSLLGLTFVALSETENTISVNERNHTQTVAIAETGAKLVLQWFQNPASMRAQGLMPVNDDLLKTKRTIGSYSGYYKPAASSSPPPLLCDRPYAPADSDRFYADEANPDIWIRPTDTAFLSSLNAKLFPNSLEAGQITDIRIYAPPNSGGTRVADGAGNFFWIGGAPYGIATIRVTASKFDTAATPHVIAQAVVRLVVSPFPLPGPSGAIQSVGNIANTGNFDVHWGNVESQFNINPAKQYLTLPWFNAYDFAHFENGYDSSTEWKASTTYQSNPAYPLGDTTRPTAGGGHEYVAIAGTMSGNTEPGSGGLPPWPTASGATWVGDGSPAQGNITWRERASTMYPLKKTDLTNYDNHNWLFEVIGNGANHSLDDPWFNIRSWGTVAASGPSPHPYPYALSPPPVYPWGHTEYFQYQTFSQKPDYRRVDVPQFDYNFWKAAALAGRNLPGVRYLTYDPVSSTATTPMYTNGVTTQTVNAWLLSGTGFFFFETMNSLNPQNGGPGILAPGNGDPCGYSGFVYANIATVGSTGCPGGGGYVPQPAEPFRDVGYRKVVETTVGTQTRGQWATDAAGKYVYIGAFNGQWDFQDLDWSNTGGNSFSSGQKNSIFDVFVAQKTVKLESTGANATDWVPIEYYPGCKPGNNSSCPSCNCSEPHEPYLNILYNGNIVGIAPGWADPVTVGQPKVTAPNNLPNDIPVTCSAADVASAAGQQRCTTNAYDSYLSGGPTGGGLTNNFTGSFKPIQSRGVLYNEGGFTNQGNNAYFGSIVVRGAVTGSGTCDVWFDDRLIHGGWPPAGVNFPRVLATSEQIQ